MLIHPWIKFKNYKTLLLSWRINWHLVIDIHATVIILYEWHPHGYNHIQPWGICFGVLETNTSLLLHSCFFGNPFWNHVDTCICYLFIVVILWCLLILHLYKRKKPKYYKVSSFFHCAKSKSTKGFSLFLDFLVFVAFYNIIAMKD
jgi:hypothetical protein